MGKGYSVNKFNFYKIQFFFLKVSFYSSRIPRYKNKEMKKRV